MSTISSWNETIRQVETGLADIQGELVAIRNPIQWRTATKRDFFSSAERTITAMPGRLSSLRDTLYDACRQMTAQIDIASIPKCIQQVDALDFRLLLAEKQVKELRPYCDTKDYLPLYEVACKLKKGGPYCDIEPFSHLLQEPNVPDKAERKRLFVCTELFCEVLQLTSVRSVVFGIDAQIQQAQRNLKGLEKRPLKEASNEEVNLTNLVVTVKARLLERKFSKDELDGYLALLSATDSFATRFDIRYIQSLVSTANKLLSIESKATQVAVQELLQHRTALELYESAKRVQEAIEATTAETKVCAYLRRIQGVLQDVYTKRAKELLVLSKEEEAAKEAFLRGDAVDQERLICYIEKRMVLSLLQLGSYDTELEIVLELFQGDLSHLPVAAYEAALGEKRVKELEVPAQILVSSIKDVNIRAYAANCQRLLAYTGNQAVRNFLVEALNKVAPKVGLLRYADGDFDTMILNTLASALYSETPEEQAASHLELMQIFENREYDARVNKLPEALRELVVDASIDRLSATCFEDGADLPLTTYEKILLYSPNGPIENYIQSTEVTKEKSTIRFVLYKLLKYERSLLPDDQVLTKRFISHRGTHYVTDWITTHEEFREKE